MGVKVTYSKNQSKRLTNLRSELSQNKELADNYKKYCSYKELQNQIVKTKNELDYAQNFSNIEINKIVNLLKVCEFLDSDGKILRKGIIAAQINECNALILTEMITQSYFSGLTAEEIIGLLAIFIDESKGEDRIEFGQLNATPTLKKYISDLSYLIEEYKNLESDIGINSDVKYWEIQ